MIGEAILNDVATAVETIGLAEDVSAHLRKQWPDIHFTYCQDDDITAAKPVRTCKDFNLYLVSGGQGCISFTSDYDRATGIVVADLDVWEDS